MSKASDLIKRHNKAALKRNHSKVALDDLQFEISYHLILIFSFSSSDNLNGWKKELNAWRSMLVKLKQGKGPNNNLTHKTLVRVLWEEPLEEESDRILRIKEIFKEKNISVPSLEIRLDEFKSLVFKYIDSIHNDHEFS